jgi:hypothetical protein
MTTGKLDLGRQFRDRTEKRGPGLQAGSWLGVVDATE